VDDYRRKAPTVAADLEHQVLTAAGCRPMVGARFLFAAPQEFARELKVECSSSFESLLAKRPDQPLEN